MNQQDIDRWRIDPPEDSIPGSIPIWLKAWDEDIETRKAFAAIYDAGFREGYKKGLENRN